MKNVKIIAAYLPQFHEIEENNKWWGKGYTDWVAVKNAKPLFEGHDQPKIPKDCHYYSLDNKDEIRWQAELAKKHGIDGFAIYHYWFSSKQHLLGKPAEIILENKDINIQYFLVWDNNSWVNKTWKGIKFTNNWVPNQTTKDNNNGMLAEVIYGDEAEWKKHYNYLLPFFKDERYIRIDNKPVLGIFSPANDNETIIKMTEYLNNLAIMDGLGGIVFISAGTFSKVRLDYEFRYEPFNVCTPLDYIYRKVKTRKPNAMKIYKYDNVWRKILCNAIFFSNDKVLFGGFVRYDDTPRRGKSASVIVGGTPKKFYEYIKKLIEISEKKHKPLIYLTAWNEWGEGAYLEPDTTSGLEYLNALKRAIDDYDN